MPRHRYAPAVVLQVTPIGSRGNALGPPREMTVDAFLAARKDREASRVRKLRPGEATTIGCEPPKAGECLVVRRVR